MFSKKELKHLATLARIELSDAELEKFSRQLVSILEYIEQLKELDVTKVTPTTHVMSIEDVFRDDVVKPSIDIEQVLKFAPDRYGNFFRVPKIIE
jgi:aspartyl-tRNA(Asn)/glutamyl-tRNA(Gln) amidotransferase subunit C